MQEKMIFLKRRIAILLLLIAGFCVQTMFILNNDMTAFERNVYAKLAGLISPALTLFMTVVSDLGSVMAVTVIIFILLLLPRTRRTFGFPVMAAVSASVILNYLLKNAIARPRPDIMRLVYEIGYGFPSGHSMNNAALYTMLALVVFRQKKSLYVRFLIAALFAVMPFFIGISRIYLGVHNTADVLAGWAMGAVCAFITDTLWLLYLRDSFRSPF